MINNLSTNINQNLKIKSKLKFTLKTTKQIKLQKFLYIQITLFLIEYT